MISLKSHHPPHAPKVYRFSLYSGATPRPPRKQITATILLTVTFAASLLLYPQTCLRLTDAPCDDTYAKALYVNLQVLEPIVRKVYAAFRADLPTALRRRRKRPLRIIVALTLLPYYGQHPLDSLDTHPASARPAPARSSPTPPPTSCSTASTSPWRSCR